MTIKLPIADLGLAWAVTRNENPTPAAERVAILANPGFGKHFTDHMVDVCWSKQGGWHRPRVSPYGPSSCPRPPRSSTMPRRSSRGSRRIAIPTARSGPSGPRPTRRACSGRPGAWRSRSCPPSTSSIRCASSSRSTVPGSRPPRRRASTCDPSCSRRRRSWASEPADTIAYYVIASPAGAYFSGGVAPVSIWLSTRYARAAEGGTGECQDGRQLRRQPPAAVGSVRARCQQVLFLDADGNLEELRVA